MFTEKELAKSCLICFQELSIVVTLDAEKIKKGFVKKFGPFNRASKSKKAFMKSAIARDVLLYAVKSVKYKHIINSLRDPEYVKVLKQGSVFLSVEEEFLDESFTAYFIKNYYIKGISEYDREWEIFNKFPRMYMNVFAKKNIPSYILKPALILLGFLLYLLFYLEVIFLMHTVFVPAYVSGRSGGVLVFILYFFVFVLFVCLNIFLARFLSEMFASMSIKKNMPLRFFIIVLGSYFFMPSMWQFILNNFMFQNVPDLSETVFSFLSVKSLARLNLFYYVYFTLLVLFIYLRYRDIKELRQKINLNKAIHTPKWTAILYKKLFVKEKDMEDFCRREDFPKIFSSAMKILHIRTFYGVSSVSILKAFRKRCAHLLKDMKYTGRYESLRRFILLASSRDLALVMIGASQKKNIAITECVKNIKQLITEESMDLNDVSFFEERFKYYMEEFDVFVMYKSGYISASRLKMKEESPFFYVFLRCLFAVFFIEFLRWVSLNIMHFLIRVHFAEHFLSDLFAFKMTTLFIFMTNSIGILIAGMVLGRYFSGEIAGKFINIKNGRTKLITYLAASSGLIVSLIVFWIIKTSVFCVPFIHKYISLPMVMENSFGARLMDYLIIDSVTLAVFFILCIYAFDKFASLKKQINVNIIKNIQENSFYKQLTLFMKVSE